MFHDKVDTNDLLVFLEKIYILIIVQYYYDKLDNLPLDVILKFCFNSPKFILRQNSRIS